MSALGKKDEDRMLWMLEVDDDFTKFTLRLFAGRKMDGTDFLYSLFDLLEEYKEDPDMIFYEYTKMREDRH